MSVRWQARQDLVHEVVLLARQQVPRRAIARAVRVSRNTVKKILEAHAEQREEGHVALAAPANRGRGFRGGPGRSRSQKSREKQ